MVIDGEKQKTNDGLGLKKLLNNLRYGYLGENDTKRVIISSQLSHNRERQLLAV